MESSYQRKGSGSEISLPPALSTRTTRSDARSIRRPPSISSLETRNSAGRSSCDLFGESFSGGIFVMIRLVTRDLGSSPAAWTRRARKLQSRATKRSRIAPNIDAFPFVEMGGMATCSPPVTYHRVCHGCLWVRRLDVFADYPTPRRGRLRSSAERSPDSNIGRIPKTEFRGPQGTGLLTSWGVLTRESESFRANCRIATATGWARGARGARAKSERAGNFEKRSKTGRKNAKSRERKLSARCVNFCVALFVDEIRAPPPGLEPGTRGLTVRCSTN
jgi:hypothetical protein